MSLDIDNSNTRVTMSFTPSEYILVEHPEDAANGDWSLNYLIDRSEKGKTPDIGIEKLWLDNHEVEVFKKAGFSWIQG